MRRLLLTALCGIPLAGCAGGLKGVLNTLDAPQREAKNDIPDAPPMDTERSRTLFLIIVQGLQDSGKPRAAIAYLRQYGKLYPNDPKAQLLLADCLMASHEEAEAATIYQTLGSGAQAAASDAGLGRVAASRSAWPDAAAFFQKAAARDTANPSYLNDLGFAEIMGGHPELALGALRQAHELAPDNAKARNNLILALHLMGNDAEARALVSAIARPDERARGGALLTLDAGKLHAGAALPSQTLAAADTPFKQQATR